MGVGIGKADEVAIPVPLIAGTDEVGSATNGLGDRELEIPAPLGLRPRFNDPRGRPRLDDDGTYCWSRLLLERTEVKYGVVIWAGSKENLRISIKTNKSYRMVEPNTTTSASNPIRGRGRGKSRGGLGKYLRARGRGGRGRPAEFNTRLVLEGERKPELTEEEEAELAREIREKYSRRQLGTNEDRYKEEEAELNSDGEY